MSNVVIASKVVRRVGLPPKQIELNVVYIKPKREGELPLVGVVGQYKGENVWGYGKVNQTMCNTSKALGEWLSVAFNDKLQGLAGRVAVYKDKGVWEYTPFDDVLYGLALNLKNGRVFIEPRVGMSAIKEIARAIGWDVKVVEDSVNYVQPVVKKIVLTERV
jgi:hypothetical protein